MSGSLRTSTERALGKISIVVPCYNEAENIESLIKAIEMEMVANLPSHPFEIIVIDNKSTDETRAILKRICTSDQKVKAILNAKNFGPFNSPYYGLLQASGDCVMLVCADFQDPIELIPVFVSEWVKGADIVCGIKSKSKESRLMYGLRSIYYKLIRKMSNVEQIEHFTGFGLYDRSFIEILRSLDDPTPFLRGIVAELGFNRVDIEYTQPRRRHGKSHNSFYDLYDAAMLSFTSYTKSGMRVAIFAGFALSAISIVIALLYLILKLTFWDWFPGGSIPVLLMVLVFGSIQLFFTGLLGEYIMAINIRVMKRPLVITEGRLNFNEPTAVDEGSIDQSGLLGGSASQIDVIAVSRSGVLSDSEKHEGI